MYQSCRENTLFDDAVYGPLWQHIDQAQRRAHRRRHTRRQHRQARASAKAHTNRGAAAENRALAHLQAAGLQPLARNLTCRHGEIDLAMRDGDTLVFVEVRLRRRRNHGGAAASVDRHKLARWRVAAEHWLPALTHAHFDGKTPHCRFDVMAFEGRTVHWLRQVIDEHSTTLR